MPAAGAEMDDIVGDHALNDFVPGQQAAQRFGVGDAVLDAEHRGAVRPGGDSAAAASCRCCAAKPRSRPGQHGRSVESESARGDRRFPTIRIAKRMPAQPAPRRPRRPKKDNHPASQAPRQAADRTAPELRILAQPLPGTARALIRQPSPSGGAPSPEDAIGIPRGTKTPSRARAASSLGEPLAMPPHVLVEADGWEGGQNSFRTRFPDRLGRRVIVTDERKGWLLPCRAGEFRRGKAHSSGLRGFAAIEHAPRRGEADWSCRDGSAPSGPLASHARIVGELIDEFIPLLGPPERR